MINLIRLIAILLCISILSGCSQVKQSGLSIKSVSPQQVKVGGEENFIVRFQAAENSAIDSQRFIIEFEDGSDDYDLDNPPGFEAIHLGNGLFETRVNGWVAGTRRLLISDQYSGLSQQVDLQFIAESPAKIALFNVSTPQQFDNPLDEASYELALVDRFGNILTGTSIKASSSYGNIKTIQQADNSWLVQVQVSGYGNNSIDVTMEHDRIQYQFNDQVTFSAVQLQGRDAFELNGEAVKIPLKTFVPDSVCQSLQSMEFVFIVPDQIKLIKAEVNDEVFQGAVVTKQDQLGQTHVFFNGNYHDDIISQGGCKYPAGNLYFEPITPGTHYLVGGGGFTLVTDNEGAEEEVCNDEVECEIIPIGINDTHMSIIYTPVALDPTFGTGKPVKNICLDFIVAPDTDRSAVISLGTIVDTTENIFKDNASNCHCPFFVRIESYRIHQLDTQEWRDSFSRRGNLGWSKMPSPQKVKRWLDNPGDVTYQRRGMCTAVFISDMPGTKKGRHVHGGGLDTGNAENYLILDHVKGFENSGRTLAHELGHAFSDGEVLDSSKPNSASQGAKQKNNLYNYGGDGTNITATQCNEFDWDHDRFNNPPN